MDITNQNSVIKLVVFLNIKNNFLNANLKYNNNKKKNLYLKTLLV